MGADSAWLPHGHRHAFLLQQTFSSFVYLFTYLVLFFLCVGGIRFLPISFFFLAMLLNRDESLVSLSPKIELISTAAQLPL